MPALRNNKHERFARLLFEGLAEGNEVWRAYVAAGYTRHRPSAKVDSTRLLKSAPEIIERVREFQQQAAAQSGETVEKVTAELNDIIKDARQDRAHGAAITGVGLKSKILGLVIDKQEVGKAGDFTKANTTEGIAKQVLQEAGVNSPNDAQTALAIEELRRHSRAISAIAQMLTQPDASVLTNAQSSSSTLSH